MPSLQETSTWPDRTERDLWEPTNDSPASDELGDFNWELHGSTEGTVSNMVTGARNGQNDAEQHEPTDSSPYPAPIAVLSLLDDVPAEDLRSMGFPDSDIPVASTTTHTNGESQDPESSDHEYGLADILDLSFPDWGFNVDEALGFRSEDWDERYAAFRRRNRAGVRAPSSDLQHHPQSTGTGRMGASALPYQIPPDSGHLEALSRAQTGNNLATSVSQPVEDSIHQGYGLAEIFGTSEGEFDTPIHAAFNYTLEDEPNSANPRHNLTDSGDSEQPRHEYNTNGPATSGFNLEDLDYDVCNNTRPMEDVVNAFEPLYLQ